MIIAFLNERLKPNLASAPECSARRRLMAGLGFNTAFPALVNYRPV